MSQVITNAFETYWQGCLTDQVPVVLDEVVLADIPNLDITAPIDPNTGLPPEAQIVHRHPVDQRGRINNNAVAYSIVMDTTVGNFSFNAMYLVNKASGMVGMIVYKGRETKTKTDPATGTTGNSLVKSMLMEYDQAATATVTTVEAGTWQIDYSARLNGMEEQQRLHAIAIFGASAFFGDGFKLVNKANAYKVQPGVAMVGGLRIQLDVEQVVAVGAKPVGVWVDVHRAGTILSRWDNHFEFKTSTTELTDYTDSNGYRHYVAKLGVVEANATVTDKRPANESADLWAALEALRKQTEKSASDMEKALADHAKGRDHPSATTTEQGMVRMATDDEARLGSAIDAVMSAKNVADAVKEMLKQMFVGIPLPWMSATPPTWAINMVGQAINPVTDPILASRYPSGIVPDHRAMTTRGWDAGRGIDVGRALLSYQPDQQQPITGRLWNSGGVNQFLGEKIYTEGAFSTDGNDKCLASNDITVFAGPSELKFNSANVVRTGPENTVKSLAYNIITMRG
ncbi:phage tail protein [Aeromonas sp. FDAARGOS 1407]|uniref:phage tail-collar fiber domain-containing protein n=1 Tax=Aeromonas TaxID=642 RepID=UPI001C243546|nr:phage tail protein [Aeromonas sp. FDAARGOS 1407]QXC35161.1 phage tail protein [Aeromonas sp. FDAARGOS 1407]